MTTETTLKTVSWKVYTFRSISILFLSSLQLRIIRGKSLIFVCGTNRSYKLKLFLKQFGVGAVILSSELDAKSRQNAVLQFNKGKYDVLIANDQADIDEEIVEGENEKVTFSAENIPKNSQMKFSRVKKTRTSRRKQKMI